MKNLLFIIVLSAMFSGCASDRQTARSPALLSFEELAAEISVRRIPADQPAGEPVDIENLVATQ